MKGNSVVSWRVCTARPFRLSPPLTDRSWPQPQDDPLPVGVLDAVDEVPNEAPRTLATCHLKRHRAVLIARPPTGDLLHIGSSNAIGVYGDVVERVKSLIEEGRAPTNLFDEVSEEVLNDLQHDVFPRFLRRENPFYRNYIRTKVRRLCALPHRRHVQR